MSIQWNEDGLNELLGGIQKQVDDVLSNIEIPAGSSVEDIEVILTEKLESAGITPDAAGIREHAEELHADLSK